MAKQPAKKTTAKKTTTKKVATKKAAPKKKQAVKKKAAPKKDAVKKVYAKVEAIAEEHGIDIDTYEDEAIKIVNEISEKVTAEITKQKKSFFKKLFSWLKK